MHPRYVEVMHMVCKMVAITEDPAAGTHRQMKGQAALSVVAPRVHSRLHHALAHGVAVEKLRQMANRVVHPTPPSAQRPAESKAIKLSRQRGLDRVVHVQLIDRLVNSPALRLYIPQVSHDILAMDLLQRTLQTVYRKT